MLYKLMFNACTAKIDFSKKFSLISDFVYKKGAIDCVCAHYE